MKFKNYNKMILKTAAITFGATVLAGIVCLFFLTLFSPISLAKFSSSLGLDGISAHYYGLSYKKTNNINDLYHLLNKNIKLQKENKIVENFELLYEEGSTRYYEFIDYIDEYQISSGVNNALKGYIPKEHSRLKARYVIALLRTQNQNKSLGVVVHSLMQETYDYTKGVDFPLADYIFELSFQNASLQQFLALTNYSYNDIELNLVQEGLNYYEQVKTIYLEELDSAQDSAGYINLAQTANSLIKMTNALVLLDNKLELPYIDSSLLQVEKSNYFEDFKQIIQNI